LHGKIQNKKQFIVAIPRTGKEKKLGKYQDKYIKMYQVHYSKKIKKNNVKITNNGFCGVIYCCLASVPAYLGDKKKTLAKILYKPREKEGTELRESALKELCGRPE
jgi:hypothetical protein